ncbi:MAG: DUF3592 domain-containing protein [Pseudomonadota bacterium]
MRYLFFVVLLAGVAIFAGLAWFLLCSARAQGRVISTAARAWRNSDTGYDGIHYFSTISFTVGHDTHQFENPNSHVVPEVVGDVVTVRYRRSNPAQASVDNGWLMTLVALAGCAGLATFAAKVVFE